VSRDVKSRSAAVNEVFGDVLPESSSDDRDLDVAEDRRERDRWIRENRPPHHR